jgi:hypothetical protein
MYSYRVIFRSAIIIVSACDADDAQEKAIDQLETEGRVHDEIVGIIRLTAI